MKLTTLTVLVLLLLTSQTIFAQTKSSDPWKFVPETVMASKSAARQIVPKAYRTASLDVPKMKSLLAKAPLWQTQEAENQEVVVTLPMPDGKMERFRIMEAPVMHPDLQAQYPTIRSYAGIGIDDPTAYFRGDFTPKGFHGMVRSPEHSTVYIDPYSTADVVNYQVYYRSDFSKDDPWQCDFDDINHEHKPTPVGPDKMAGDCQLRTYTLALACTGEYATFHGGTTALVLAAFNTTMTRVNGVFEQDASVHMTLHPNTSALIFLNASTDPYTNTDGSAMLAQNQTTCDNTIGNANYDIGHVFSTGGGGVAYLGAVCTNNLKAGGVTGQGSPVGDPFDIDYVAHEMGHQYGANHTQNNACNRNSSTAMEPGSASTIMGYAGICAPNVQNNSDDYFHAISLQEIAAEVTGQGNTCSTNTSINNAPTANAGADYVIPRSTPFILTGTGTDPSTGPVDVLTYTWEQMDFAVATMPPAATNTGGPTFRSFKGTTSPSRYLPRLLDVVNNVNPTWEVLPSVARTLNFRLTVRDNRVGGGCTAEDNMVVTVNGTAGPFVVTAPNTAVNWPATSSQTVTWNVASTNVAPVNCANVDILLSTDGGLTYPTVLATGTPNDGTQAITLPNVTSTTARIMVKGNGNIFYDISNVNFTISVATNGFTVDASPNSQSVCTPTNAIFTTAIGVTGSFSGNVAMSVTGLPAGATGIFVPTTVTAPGSSTLTVTTAGVAAGTYNLTITGTSGSTSQSETVALTVLAGAPGQAVLTSPANGATGVSQMPTFTWNAASGASSYSLQVATDAAFSNIVASPSGIVGTTYMLTTTLSPNTNYFWRIAASNTCGSGSNSAAFSFTTSSTTCLTQASTNIPVTISATGTPIVTSTIVIAGSGTISDVNLLNLGITHSWINDVVVKLKSPLGTEITLLSQICGDQDNILTNFDDAGLAYTSLPCPPTNNGTYQPSQALSVFNGQSITGTWTLTVQDLANQDGGSLNSWSLNLCYTPGAAPVSVTVTGTNVSCNGGNDGTATATASGGTGTYTYAWSNGGTTQTISGLTAGIYACTVTSGGTAAGSVNLTQPAVLVANVTGTNPTSGNNGSATSNPTGGTAPYTFKWSDGSMTQTITGLAAGTYTCTVTSSGGCTATGSVTLTGTTPVSVTVTGTNVSCNGGNNGTATANATGGTGTYTYAWSNGGTTQTISGLTAGTYICTVTSGGTASGNYTVTQPTAVIANVTGNNPNSGNNGTATASPTGGTAPYTYAWSNGGTTQTISSLAAGTYTCSVTSTGGCTATGSVTLTSTGCNTQTVNSQNFETGFGIWIDGGTDCARINNAAFANSGTFSIQLRDNTTTSLMSTSNLNLTAYNQVTVTFSFITGGFANGEDFWLQRSTNGGASYTTIKTWVAGTNFTNGVRGTGTHTLTGPFTSNTRFRIRCDASTDSDVVYIDDAVITGCLNFTGGDEEERIINDENEVTATAAETLLAYPNPTQEMLNVEFSQSENAATLVISDMLGRAIQQQKVESNGTGLQKVSIDVNQLQPGSYLLQVFDGKTRRYVQFVKMSN